jgi:hypothetical protein
MGRRRTKSDPTNIPRKNLTNVERRSDFIFFCKSIKRCTILNTFQYYFNLYPHTMKFLQYYNENRSEGRKPLIVPGDAWCDTFVTIRSPDSDEIAYLKTLFPRYNEANLTIIPCHKLFLMAAFPIIHVGWMDDPAKPALDLTTHNPVAVLICLAHVYMDFTIVRPYFMDIVHLTSCAILMDYLGNEPFCNTYLKSVYDIYSPDMTWRVSFAKGDVLPPMDRNRLLNLSVTILYQLQYIANVDSLRITLNRFYVELKESTASKWFAAGAHLYYRKTYHVKESELKFSLISQILALVFFRIINITAYHMEGLAHLQPEVRDMLDDLSHEMMEMLLRYTHGVYTILEDIILPGGYTWNAIFTMFIRWIKVYPEDRMKLVNSVKDLHMIFSPKFARESNELGEALCFFVCGEPNERSVPNNKEAGKAVQSLLSQTYPMRLITHDTRNRDRGFFKVYGAPRTKNTSYVVHPIDCISEQTNRMKHAEHQRGKGDQEEGQEGMPDPQNP